MARLRHLVRVWDEAVRVPGTRLAVGLDALVGLVPGLGDALGALVAGSVVLTALRAGVPVTVAARMLVNIALDAGAGAVPLVGDLFDAVFRANARNLALLERWLADPARATRRSRVALASLAAAVVALLAAVGYAAWCIARAALRLIM